MHDAHAQSFFGHAVAFLLAFAGDDGEPDAKAEREPAAGFVTRFARLVAHTPASCAGELVGVVAGVLVDAGAGRGLARR